MVQNIFITDSSEETYALGRKLAKRIKPGVVLALEGDLGAGKTTFVKGIANGLGIKKRIISPSFIIQNIHKDKNLVLYHFDLYRLEKMDEETAETVRESIGDPRGVSVIEWAEKITFSLPKSTIYVKFNHFGKNKRRVEINESGN